MEAALNRLTGRGWKRSEVHARQSLPCYQQTVKGNCVDSSQRKEYRENLNLLRKYLSNPEYNISRDMDSKGHLD